VGDVPPGTEELVSLFEQAVRRGQTATSATRSENHLTLFIKFFLLKANLIEFVNIKDREEKKQLSTRLGCEFECSLGSGALENIMQILRTCGHMIHQGAAFGKSE